jgi:hypothetical protein
MATAEQRARRSAQRRTAKAVREKRTQVPSGYKTGVKAARIDYYNGVISGKYPAPAPGTMEAKNLASIASLASRGKAPAKYEKAFKEYWYHDNQHRTGTAGHYEWVSDYEDEPDDDGEE